MECRRLLQSVEVEGRRLRDVLVLTTNGRTSDVRWKNGTCIKSDLCDGNQGLQQLTNHIPFPCHSPLLVIVADEPNSTPDDTYRQL